MKRPDRKAYIGKSTKIQLIADLEQYIDYLESKLKNHGVSHHVSESASDAFDRGFTAGYNAGVKMGLAAD